MTHRSNQSALWLVCCALWLAACQGDAPKTLSSSLMYQKSDIAAPRAAKQPKELSIHGDTRLDNYYWLNERENPDVIAYLNAENAYTDTMLAHTRQFQEKLYTEIIGRIKQTDESVPYRDNGYWYYTRFEEGKEYPIHCRKAGSMEAPEDIMLDVNLMAQPYAYYAAAGLNVSPDNRLLAFGEDTLSRRQYTLRFKNLETGDMLPDAIPNTVGSVAWANDSKTLFYTKKDPQTLRSNRVYRHVLGSDPAKDELVFEEKDETFYTYAYRAKSGRYIFIYSSSTLTSEQRFLDADRPGGQFSILQPRERGHEYSADHFGEHFYIISNWEAKNFRLMRTPVGQSAKANWEEVVAHRPDVLLEGMELFKNYLVLSERVKGVTELRVMPWAGGEAYYVPFDEASHSVGTSVNRDFDTETLRFSYTSMTVPQSTFDFNMATRERQLLKQQEVLGGYDANAYTSERLYAKASDGTLVPISLVYKKGIKKDGKQPLLLYGYGSYGNSMDPYFSSVRLSLLDRGFVYAIAHVRGGQEMGRQWYEDGKLLKKMNTFTDFIACAEHLIGEGYTSPEQLYAMGGSAGGLLMGAVINLRPDLFNGIVATVPFVDVVTTMLDESIPLTTGEFDEWGNPKDAEYYAYMKSYSPYDNVAAKEYPAMLVTTGLHDSQVQYWEPAKWVAKLRELKTDNQPLLLHTNMDAGHGGASGRFQRYREVAMEYAFLLDLAGRTE